MCNKEICNKHLMFYFNELVHKVCKGQNCSRRNFLFNGGVEMFKILRVTKDRNIVLKVIPSRIFRKLIEYPIFC